MEVKKPDAGAPKPEEASLGMQQMQQAQKLWEQQKPKKEEEIAGMKYRRMMMGEGDDG